MTTSVRLAALAALGALLACAGAKPPPPANVPVFSPTVSVRTVALAGADFEAATVVLGLDVTNPNPFALPVTRVAYVVEVDGQPALAGTGGADVAVASSGTFPVSVPVRLPYGPIPGIAARLSAGQPMAYRARGTVGFQTPAGILDLPVTWEGTLPLPRAPELSFNGVSVGLLSAIRLSFDVKLRVFNPNGFPIPAGRLAHQLTVAGARLARGEEQLPAVPAGGTAEMAIPASVDRVGAGTGAVMAVVAAFQNEEIPVAVEGQATLGGILIPARFEAVIPKLRP
jgi:LEA14-like dessication related protein